MLRFFFMMMFVGAVATLNAAENLLKNADFRNLSTACLPVDWQVRGPTAAVKVSDGILTLSPQNAQDNLLLVQSGSDLKDASRYRLSFEVRSKTGSDYRVYAEYKQTINSQAVFKSFNSAFRAAAADWSTQTVDFDLPKNYGGVAVVFNVKGAVTVEFRHLSMVRLGDFNVPESPSVSRVKWGSDWQFAPGSASTATGIKIAPAAEIAASCTVSSLKPGQRYCLEYVAKGEGNSGDATGFYFYQLGMHFSASQQVIMSPLEDTWQVTFQRKRLIFTAPSDTGRFSVYSKTKGVLLLQEFALRELSDAAAETARIVLTAPRYRDNIYAAQKVDDITGVVQCDLPKVSGQVQLTGKNGQFLVPGVVQPQGRNLAFTIPIKTLPVGQYQLAAELKFPDGKVSTLQMPINRYPSSNHEVLIGNNNNIYQNNQVFLPVIMWYIADFNRDENLYYAARNGVNCTLVSATDATSLQRLLDRAQRFGLKLVVRTQVPKNTSEEAYRNWFNQVKAIFSRENRQHPALLAYFLMDEPGWVGYSAETLTHCYKDLKAFDPFHPVWINEAPRGTIAEQSVYAAASDIFGVDIYPVPQPSNHSHLEDKTLSCVGKYARRQAEIAGGRKAVWMALQGMAWDSFNGDDTRKPYPTVAETRFMVYDSFINGANCVSWWGTQYIKTPSFYDTIFGATRELQILSGILVAEKTDVPGKVEPAAIEYRRYRGEDWGVIIAANTSAEERNAVFDGAIFNAGVVTVLGENRNITVGNDQWRDRFAPYAVHIYVQGKLPPPNYVPPPLDPKLEPEAGINPFARGCLQYKQSVPYAGKAAWIWEKSLLTTPGGKILLRREFTVRSAIKSAVLRIAADDEAEITLNGHRLGQVGDWNLMSCFALTPYLKSGVNTMSVSAADHGALPCGVLAEIHVEYADGAKEIINSDATWQAARLDAANTWTPADIVAEYGAGVWGANVRVVTPIK